MPRTHSSLAHPHSNMWSSARPLLLALPLLLAACQSSSTFTGDAQALAALRASPLPATPWTFTNAEGLLITSPHYHIYTTLDDPIYQRLLPKVLEAAHDRALQTNPAAATRPNINGPLNCYVFASRAQWEDYTRLHAGPNASIYLRVAAGGYSQQGVFAGYDIGRDQTLSVIAHEAWHQFSWFAFKNHLPSWLEEGLATQNEGIDWDGTTPRFRPERNYKRYLALKEAIRDDRLWSLADLASTHAGRVIKLPQRQIDSYYAQLWSLVLFLQTSPTYAPRLQHLLADASNGTLVNCLANTGITQHEIDGFTEHWNTLAGPTYLKTYITPNLPALQKQYESWARQFTTSWPPPATPTPSGPVGPLQE